ncbi:hypothetical protein ABT185_07635 [Streptomyces clavifer]
MGKKTQPVTPAREPSSVVGQPATVAACRQDYAKGAAARDAMTQAARRR